MNQAVGAPLSRVDGKLKVTGQAPYAADHHVDGVAYGVIVASTVGAGRITGIDTGPALAQPGVLTVITHGNAPRLPYRPYRNFLVPQGERLHVLQDDQVHFFGQPVAVVVAETLEAAQHAASLVDVAYDSRPPTLDLTGAPTNEPFTYARGDAEGALGSAEVRLEMTYRAARNHHNALEPHATIARWDGDRLTVWDKTQYLVGTQGELAAVFDIPVEAVRVICPFIGGAFGNGLRCWPHTTVAALAARVTERPVKVVLTRRQLYFGVGYRPTYEYGVRLGGDRQGRLSAMTHDARFETSRYERHGEGIQALGQMLYETPNVSQTFRNVPLDVNTPTWMRGPGYSTAAYAIESALDELAHELGVDPIELRLRNEPDDDPASGLPFSTRRLRECLAVGAREFGWHKRKPEPRSTVDGDRLIGIGMAAGAYHTLRGAARAYARLTAEGTALLQAGAGDMGPGTYTSMTQIAADALGMPMNTVRFELGDSTMPQVPPHGGSQTMASVGSAVQNACDQLRQQAITLAVTDERSPLHGVKPEDVIVRDGRMRVKNDPTRGETTPSSPSGPTPTRPPSIVLSAGTSTGPAGCTCSTPISSTRRRPPSRRSPAARSASWSSRPPEPTRRGQSRRGVTPPPNTQIQQGAPHGARRDLAQRHPDRPGDRPAVPLPAAGRGDRGVRHPGRPDRPGRFRPRRAPHPRLRGVLTGGGAGRGRRSHEQDPAHQRGDRAAGARPGPGLPGLRHPRPALRRSRRDHRRSQCLHRTLRHLRCRPRRLRRRVQREARPAPATARGRPRHLVRQVPPTTAPRPRHPARGPAAAAGLARGGRLPDSAERAGRLGLPMVLGYIGGPLSHARHAVDIYRAAGERAGHPDKLRVGISTHFYAAATPEDARRTFPYYHEYLRPKTPGGRGFVVDQAQFDAGTRRGNAIMIGSSEQLIEKILDAHQTLGLDRFLGQIDWGGLPRAAVSDSIHRYAEEIAPAVRATTA
nr:LLM class flavin-dependent oxidoreductase [Saccharothrix deserti]